MTWLTANLKKKCFREVDAYCAVFSNLIVVGKSLIKVHEMSSGKCLYSEVGTYDNKISQTMDEINREAFYGRALLYHVSRFIWSVGGSLEQKKIIVRHGSFATFFLNNERLRWPWTALTELMRTNSDDWIIQIFLVLRSTPTRWEHQ